MRFDKLIRLFIAEDFPLSSILFKADWMEHWYTPHDIVGHGENRKLVCSSPTRRDTARFDWSDDSNIRPHQILSVKVDTPSRSKILSEHRIIRITLSGRRR